MQLRRSRVWLGVILSCFIMAVQSPAYAGISKTSKRVLRASSIATVPGFSVITLSTGSLCWSWSTGTFTGAGIDGYRLYSTTAATPATALPLSPETSFYIDTRLRANQQVTRWITAYTSSDESSDSEHLFKFTKAVAPASFNLLGTTPSMAKISWSYSNATAYAVELSTNNVNYIFSRACFTPPQDIPVLSNTTYWIRLGAINGDNEQNYDSYSTVKTTTTRPFDPVFYGVAISSSIIDWRWSTGTYTNTGILKYQICYSSEVPDEVGIYASDGDVLAEFTDISTNHWTETYEGLNLFSGSEINIPSFRSEYSSLRLVVNEALFVNGFRELDDTTWTPEIVAGAFNQLICITNLSAILAANQGLSSALPGTADGNTILANKVALKGIYPNTLENAQMGRFPDNTNHARWMRVVGIQNNPIRAEAHKYTYAIAPPSNGILNVCGSPARDNIDQTWIKIAWDLTRASEYVVECSSVADFDVSCTTRIVTGPLYHIDWLEENSAYDVRIGAVNGDGEQTPDDAFNPQAYSSVYQFLTRIHTPSVACVSHSYTAIDFQWSTATYTNMNYLAGYDVSKLVYFPDVDQWILVSVAYIPSIDANHYALDYLVTNSTHSRYISAWQSHPPYQAFGSRAPETEGCTFATPPSDVVFSSVTSKTLRLSWKHAEVPATSYRIERSTTIGNKGPWVYVSTASGNAFIDTGLQYQTTYTYRIGAINQLGIQTLGMTGVFVYGSNGTDYSFVVSTLTLFGPPNIYGVALSTGSIAWSWTTAVPNPDSFTVYTDTGGVLQAGLSAATTTWLEQNLNGANQRFTRQISCAYPGGVSDVGAASRYTIALPPSTLVITSTGVHTLSLSWNGSGGSSFGIDRSLDNSAWTAVVDAAHTQAATTYTDTFLRTETTYYYAVTGYNGDGIPTASSATLASPGRTSLVDAVIISSMSTTAQTVSKAVPGMGTVMVEFPAGSAPVDGYVTINESAGSNPTENTAEDIALSIANFKPNRLIGKSIVELSYHDLYGRVIHDPFRVPVLLTMAYPDTNGDNIVDNTSPAVNITSLSFCLLDQEKKTWQALSGSINDKTAHTVRVPLSHFSSYALGGILALKTELSSVFAYPNPYRPGSSGSFDRSQWGEGIVFEGLTENVRIRVFNIVGEMVANLVDDDGDGRMVWDTCNMNGDKVASGVYIYLVSNPDDSSDKADGKISIIK